MTEDDAKTKWCPFSRELSETYTQQGEFRVSTGYSYNRSPDPHDDGGPYVPRGSLCIGSGCMAWRWNYGGPSDPPNPGDPGYCGLAGHPQGVA